MKHLLDLNDLMEEEFSQIYETEKLLCPFLQELKRRIDYTPLQEWVAAYETVCGSHIGRLEDIVMEMFMSLDPTRSYLVDDILKDYISKMNRTPDENIREEEAILALSRIIHYKMASYGTLVIHMKALKLLEEANSLELMLSEEKSLEAALSLLSEEHHVFLNDWYIA